MYSSNLYVPIFTKFDRQHHADTLLVYAKFDDQPTSYLVAKIWWVFNCIYKICLQSSECAVACVHQVLLLLDTMSEKFRSIYHCSPHLKSVIRMYNSCICYIESVILLSSESGTSVFISHHKWEKLWLNYILVSAHVVI